MTQPPRPDDTPRDPWTTGGPTSGGTSGASPQQPGASPAWGTPPEPPQPGAPSGYGAQPGYAAPGTYGAAPAYGYPGGYPGYGGPPARNGLGTGALVLGILALLSGLVGFFVITIPVAVVLGLVGIALGVAGAARAARREATNRGSAIAGIVLSVLGIVAAVLWGFLVARVVGDIDRDCRGLTGTALEQCAQQSVLDRLTQG